MTVVPPWTKKPARAKTSPPRPACARAFRTPLGRVGGRGQRLALDHAPALLIYGREVCEGAADVRRDADHAAPRSRRVCASSIAPDAASKTTR